jgi:hypothetical protein
MGQFYWLNFTMQDLPIVKRLAVRSGWELFILHQVAASLLSLSFEETLAFSLADLFALWGGITSSAVCRHRRLVMDIRGQDYGVPVSQDHMRDRFR